MFDRIEDLEKLESSRPSPSRAVACTTQVVEILADSASSP